MAQTKENLILHEDERQRLRRESQQEENGVHSRRSHQSMAKGGETERSAGTRHEVCRGREQTVFGGDGGDKVRKVGLGRAALKAGCRVLT